MAAEDRRSSEGTPSLLLPLSRHLENRCLDATEPTVLLACFQDRDRFAEETRHRYARLARRGVFTAVLGRDMPLEPGPGIRGADLGPADPVAREWTVIVLGSHFAAALLAKERGSERLFDFVVTHDRDVVIAAARPLIKRILATDS
jgi:DICT domain-containing protein